MDSPAVQAAQAAIAMRAKYGVSFNKNMDVSSVVKQWTQAQAQNPQLAGNFPAINVLMQTASAAIQTLNTASNLKNGLATALQVIETAVVAMGATAGYAPATPANPGYAAALTALQTAQAAQTVAANAIQSLNQQLLTALMN
jgi:hypothetical protein